MGQNGTDTAGAALAGGMGFEVREPSLAGRRIVVHGGTGGVGEGIVRAWLAAGANVVVPSRTEGRAARFRELIGEDAADGRLEMIIHNNGQDDDGPFAGAEALAERIERELGPVTDVAASIGGWWQAGPLWEVTASDWQRFFVDLTTAHVATIRAWIPRLPADGSYHLILGGSARQPVPGSSIINMEQAALQMMHAVVSAEAGTQRRLFAPILGPVATRQRNWSDPEWVSAREVGAVTLGLAADPAQPSAQFVLRTKDDARAVLAALGLADAPEGAAGQDPDQGPDQRHDQDQDPDQDRSARGEEPRA